jgi:hypothetical protein
MTAPPRIVNGSTVAAGGYECEVHDCYTWRRAGGAGRPARWTAWRLSPRNGATLDDGQVGRVTATWILCDECPRNGDDLDQFTTHLILPLLHPSDPYARIAVEELCYAIAAFGAVCAARTRAPSHPLCGWDVYGYGGSKPRRPCRARATQVVEDWLDLEFDVAGGGDLYLCDRHAKTLKRRERGEIETERVLDFGGGV